MIVPICSVTYDGVRYSIATDEPECDELGRLWYSYHHRRDGVRVPSTDVPLVVRWLLLRRAQRHDPYDAPCDIDLGTYARHGLRRILIGELRAARRARRRAAEFEALLDEEGA